MWNRKRNGPPRAPRKGDAATAGVIGTIVCIAIVIVAAVAVAPDLLRHGELKQTAHASGFNRDLATTYGNDTEGASLVLYPVAGQPIPLTQAKIEMNVDGTLRTIPLTDIADQTADGNFWRAGEEVCFVGPGSACVEANGTTVAATLFVGNQLVYRQTHHLRPFSILDSGGVVSHCGGRVDIEVVGVDITYGRNGPPIPVYVDFTEDGGDTLTALFAGGRVAAGDVATITDVEAGGILGVRGTAAGFGILLSYLSFDADPHVDVLQDGDEVPDVAAFGNQQSVEQFLEPFVQDGAVTLASNEVIILYEFNPSLSSSAADYQDLVVLFRFPGGACAA